MSSASPSPAAPSTAPALALAAATTDAPAPPAWRASAPPAGSTLAAFIACALLATACAERSRPAVLAAAASDATAVASEDDDGLTPEARDEVLATLREMGHRPSCNRIMGCPGEIALAQRGPAVVPLLAAVLRDNSAADGYWYYRVIALLGQLGDPRALPTLHRLLGDARWEVPIRAAEALGRLASPTSRAPLEAALDRARAAQNTALEAAALVALTRVDPARTAAHRAAFIALVPAAPDALAATPPVVLDILIGLVREARTPQALPGVRRAARHDNRFVRAQALDTLASLQDTGGIPYALDRLNDPLPSIRKKALAALQRITGIHTMTDAHAWRRWCEKNNLATLPP